MNAESRDVVTLGADVGGEDAHAATNEHVLALRKLLRQECRGIYSNTVKKFALVLRIDGSVQSWGKCGVDNVDFQRKKTYATADIFIPTEAWSRGDVSALRSFLGAEVKKAVIKIDECAKRQGISLELDALYRDVDRAVNKFESKGPGSN